MLKIKATGAWDVANGPRCEPVAKLNIIVLAMVLEKNANELCIVKTPFCFDTGIKTDILLSHN